MQDIQKIRFLTINYSRLQGLKGVPLGLLLLLTVLWANIQHGPARNFTPPILFALGAAVLYWWIDRYYRIRYGNVESTHQQKREDYLIAVLGGIVGLAAVYIDLTHRLVISMVGLVFAAAVLFEYMRIFRLGKNAYFLWQFVISIAIILGANLLPLFDLKGLWQGIGLRSHLFAVLVVTSIVMLVAGVCGHIYFIRQFPPKEG
jgi:hypothetical protein